jgi:diguanylate cyclase (GGDEF)-like protein/PAS domain S-box-containing protein
MTHPLRILYADDTASAEDVVRRALMGDAGQFDLCVACNRDEFELLLSGGRWDLVLSDYQSLGYDTLEIVEIVRSRDARLAVLIFTGHGSEAIAAEAIKRGATDYLIRNDEQLLRLPDTIRATVARQRGMMTSSELCAVLEATQDGIVVVSNAGRVIHSNERARALWSIPEEMSAVTDFAALQAYVAEQLVDPKDLVDVAAKSLRTEASSSTTMAFRDGRVVELHVQPQIFAGKRIGWVISYRDITAIKAVEAALRGSEARFRLMFDQTADALMILDPQTGRFSDCNQATVEMFGCASKQAILTLHPAELSPSHQPDGRDSMGKAKEMIDTAMREGGHRFEWVHCSAQREAFPAEVLLTPVLLEQQHLIVATVRDISEFKREQQTQLALRNISEAAHSTETLIEMFQRIHQIIGGLLPARNFFVALYDEKRGEITFPYYVDEFDPHPGVMKITEGTITARVIEQGVAMLFTPDSANDVRLEQLPFIGTDSLDWLGVPLKSKSRTVGALVVQSYDGSVRYTEKDKSLLEFVCGQVAAAIERKQAELDLRESEARLEEAQRLAHMGSWEWNIQGHQLTWSDELCRIFGVDPETYQPGVRDFLARLHPDDHSAVQAAMIRAQENCQPFRMEMRICRPDGEIRALQSQVEVRVDRQGRATSMVGASLDISARKLEELLERDRRRVLEQVARNESLPQILNGVVGMLEAQIAGSRCAVLLLRDGDLYRGSAPRLPEAYCQALEGLAIGPAVGSCGSACYFNEMVVVADIASDPLWDDYAELALAHDLRACWSMPIASSNGGVLGSFAVYQDHPCTPSAAELDFLTAASQLAAVAIEHRLLTEQLAHQGQHDALTGLPNRLLLQDRLGQALALAQRKLQKVAVLFMDLDHFKQINDTLGHSHGDLLLREVARRLEGCMRKSDTLARLGGDEFMVVVPELNDPQDAMRVAEKLMQALRAPFLVGQHEFFLSTSIGLSLFPTDGRVVETLMACADTAMYRAKEAGRDSCMWFTPQMNTRIVERAELERHLRHAIALGQLSLQYQAQLGQLGEITGFEALLRWEHPTLGMVPLSRFIPVAEESGLIVPIGEWVMREACERMAAWHRSGYKPLTISVNVSAVQFRRGKLVDMVHRVLTDTKLDPTALELEITESLLLENAAEASVSLAELRSLGVGVAIDDFGTGYSSLSYLHKLPVSRLKIDQSFVCEIGTEPLDGRDEAPIIRTIIALARNLGLTVIAEGVETPSQHKLLKSLGCDGFQGFLLHRPLSESDAEQLLAKTAKAQMTREPVGL